MTASKSMYNERQKLEYVEYDQKNSQMLQRLFLKISETEKMYGKDIADMNPDELTSTIMVLNMHREGYRAQVISLLRGYIRWARRFGRTDNDSTIFQISADEISSKDAIKTNMIKSPEQLESILDIATPKRKDSPNNENMPEQPNRSSRDKLVFWLLYAGISIEDIVILKKTDIDLDNKEVVVSSGVRYEVDDRAIPLWKNCAAATFIEKRNGKATARGKSNSSDVIEQQLQDSDYLFRTLRGNSIGPKSDHLSVTTHRKIVTDVCKAYNSMTGENIKVSPDNIRLSGRLYRLYLFEQQGHEVTSKELDEYLNINPSNDSDVPFNVRKFRIIYADWKLAFNYI